MQCLHTVYDNENDEKRIIFSSIHVVKFNVFAFYVMIFPLKLNFKVVDSDILMKVILYNYIYIKAVLVLLYGMLYTALELHVVELVHFTVLYIAGSWTSLQLTKVLTLFIF